MRISQQELADGFRFAGRRAGAATTYTSDWDHSPNGGWTMRETFAHLAAWSGKIDLTHAVYRGETIDVDGDQMAREVLQCTAAEFEKILVDGHEADARYIESLDPAELSREIEIPPYNLPLAEYFGICPLNHTIYHVNDATARGHFR